MRKPRKRNTKSEAAVIVTVRLPPEMLSEIDRVAAEIGVSRSDLIKARLRKAAVEDGQAATVATG